jgi:hypothetical protein
VGCRENAVLQGREVAAHFRLGADIDFGDHAAPTTRQPL